VHFNRLISVPIADGRVKAVFVKDVLGTNMQCEFLSVIVSRICHKSNANITDIKLNKLHI